MNRGPIVFDPASARRIVKQTRRAEREPQGVVKPSAPPRTLAPNKVVLSTTAIKPGAGSKPGSGSASLQVFDGTNFQDLGITITIYNLTASTIATGAYIQVVFIDGYYFYDVTDCKNGS